MKQQQQWPPRSSAVRKTLIIQARRSLTLSMLGFQRILKIISGQRMMEFSPL